jgi:hypothetical protein
VPTFGVDNSQSSDQTVDGTEEDQQSQQFSSNDDFVPPTATPHQGTCASNQSFNDINN